MLDDQTVLQANSTLAQPTRLNAARHWWLVGLLVLLAGQYAVFQLLTGVQYFDAPRNMQWSLYLLEQPRFLLGAGNTYDRINGFPPHPASLAPYSQIIPHDNPISPWWGPLYLLLFAGVWRVVGSFTVLQLISPLAAGAVVILTYLFGARWFNRRVGLLAAIMLAFFPNYREHAVLALAEPFSALLMLGAVWIFLAKRPWWAGLLGGLACLGKPDMVLLYFGTIACISLPGLRTSWRTTLRRLAPAYAVPVVLALPWFAVVYGVMQRPATFGGGPSLRILATLLPLTLEQFFTLPLPVTLLVLGLIIVPVLIGLLRHRTAATEVYYALSGWLLCGCLVLLVYAMMLGASNNPRVLIPALPALCLLFADGLLQLSARWRLVIVSIVATVFLLANLAGGLYQVVQARVNDEYRPAWAVLRNEPRGFVLTEQYWSTMLYAHQPATWFENDEAFQHNILFNVENFRHYIAENPIRYIVLPHDETTNRDFWAFPELQLYDALPFGRDPALPPARLTAPEVRAYLEQHYQQRRAGNLVIFYLQEPKQS